MEFTSEEEYTQPAALLGAPFRPVLAGSDPPLSRAGYLAVLHTTVPDIWEERFVLLEEGALKVFDSEARVPIAASFIIVFAYSACVSMNV